MNLVKGVITSLLSLLLFLSLAIFGIAFMVNSTLLNPDFIVAEVDKIDIPAVTMELAEKPLTELISNNLPPEMQSLEAPLSDIIYGIVEDLEPSLKATANTAIYSGYDFFLGRSETLEITIPLEQFKENLGTSLKDNLYPPFIQSPPPQLSGLPEEQLRAYFEQFYNELYPGFAAQIPAEFEINESLLKPGIMQQILQVKQYLGYFRAGYYALIGFMALLLLGILLINHNVKKITRGLGVTCLICGAMEYAGVFLAKYFLPSRLPLQEIPASLQPWLLELCNNLFKPLEIFSICLLVAGAVSLVISFVYKSRVTAED